MTWSEKSKQIILKVASENPQVENIELRVLLREAYPFGQRKYHPYKIWLRECSVFLEERKKVRELGVQGDER